MEEAIETIAEKYGAVGGVLVLQKPNDEGQHLAQFGLTHSQIRECLAIATYYNEKIEIENPQLPE